MPQRAALPKPSMSLARWTLGDHTRACSSVRTPSASSALPVTASPLRYALFAWSRMALPFSLKPADVHPLASSEEIEDSNA